MVATLSANFSGQFNTDIINGIHTEKVKIVYGADGQATDVTSSSPLPVILGDGSKVFTSLISNGTSLSSLIDFGSVRLKRIYIPLVWTTANLTFQISPDDATFSNVYDQFGNEFVITAGAGHAIGVLFETFLDARWMKIRSGTSGTPVNQGQDATLTIVAV